MQSQVKQIRLEDRSCKQGFHYDTKQHFEPITKTLTQTSQKVLEEKRFRTKAIENLDESNKYAKTLMFLSKNGTVYPSLVRPISKLLVPKKRSQFGLDDDSDSDDWNGFLMNIVKVRINDDRLLFRDTGVVFK